MIDAILGLALLLSCLVQWILFKWIQNLQSRIKDAEDRIMFGFSGSELISYANDEIQKTHEAIASDGKGE